MNQIKAVVEEGVHLRCRYYNGQFPKEQDLVVVEVVEVQENASYVELLEYDRIKGMITPNEMTKPMKGRIQKALKIGKQQVVRVLRVDEEQGYIDLSKKKVAKDEESECLSRYANAKMVHSIMRAISEKTKVNIEDLYKMIVWPLQIQTGKLDVLQYFRADLKAFGKLNIPDNIQEKLAEEIERRLKPEPITIRCEFELQSYDYAGLLVVKDALKAGQLKETDDCQISFEITASPVYTGKTTTTNSNGVKIMKDALAEIEAVMLKYNGVFRIKHEPKVMGDQSKMEQFQDIDEDSQEDDDKAIAASDDDEDDIGME